MKNRVLTEINLTVKFLIFLGAGVALAGFYISSGPDIASAQRAEQNEIVPLFTYVWIDSGVVSEEETVGAWVEKCMYLNPKAAVKIESAMSPLPRSTQVVCYLDPKRQ